MIPEHVQASEFKAKCLALLDEVARTGQTIVVTKHGRPVAKVAPIDPPAPLAGSVTVFDPDDDLLSTGETWDVE